MNTEPRENQAYKSPFSSHDCIDMELDGPEDNTVRPLTGDLLERALAERERIAYWEARGYSANPLPGDAAG